MYNNRDDEMDSRGRYGETSDFSTTLISNDGRFFGVKINQETASQLNTFYSVVMDWARRQGEKLTVPAVNKIGETVFNVKDAAKLTQTSNRIADAVGYGIIFSKQLFDIGGNVYDSVSKLNDLRTAVQPINRTGAGSVSPLSGDNEVVSNARSKIKNLFNSRMIQTATGAIAVAPTFFIKVSEQKQKNVQRRSDQNLDGIKNDSDKIAQEYRRQVNGATEAAEINVRQEGLKKALLQEREAYMAEYELFKTNHENKIQERLAKDLESVTAENIEQKLEALASYDINTRHIERVIEQGSQVDLKNAVDRLKAQMDELMPKLLEREIRKDFVRHKGVALNHEWQFEGLHSGDARHPTIEEQLISASRKTEENLRRIEEQHEEKKHGAEKIPAEMAKAASSLVAGVASQILGEKLVGKKLDKYNDPIALDRILNLRRTLEKYTGEPPELIADMNTHSEMGYVRYVHEIFQEHQRDCDRPEISSRFTENLEKSRWDDAAIFQMRDEDLNAYEFALKAIAKRIKDGRMDAIALVELVGNKNTKIVRNDGRSFGPAGSGRDDQKVKDAIRAIIDDKSAKLRANQEQSHAEISQKLGDFMFSVDDLKISLDDKTLDPEMRAFVFAIFSEVIGNDEQLSKMLGMSKERIVELRNQSNANFTERLDGAVAVLSDMVEQQPEKLKSLVKMSAKEEQLLTQYAAQLAEGKHVNDLTESRDDRKSIETLLANVLMASKQSPALWQEVVAVGKTQNTEASAQAAAVDSAADRGGLRSRAQRRSESFAGREAGRRESGAPEEALGV